MICWLPDDRGAGRGFVCRLIMLTFSTTTRRWAGSTRVTVPRLPASLPDSTSTESPVLILSFVVAISRESYVPAWAGFGAPANPRFAGADGRFERPVEEGARAGTLGSPTLKNLWCERDDLHEVALAQLARDGAEDARPARVSLSVDDHRRVLVERDV